MIYEETEGLTHSLWQAGIAKLKAGTRFFSNASALRLTHGIKHLSSNSMHFSC